MSKFTSIFILVHLHIQGVPKNLTSFCRQIILAVLIEITSWKVNMRTSFFNRMGLHPTERRQYVFISMRICLRDRSGVMEIKTVF